MHCLVIELPSHLQLSESLNGMTAAEAFLFSRDLEVVFDFGWILPGLVFSPLTLYFLHGPDLWGRWLDFGQF